MPIDKNGKYFVYAIIANIIDKFYIGSDKTISRGTKQFRPNAKVYCIFIYGGTGHENLIVIGKPRKIGRMISISMRTERLKNFRIQKVYSPTIIDLITKNETFNKPTKDKDYQQYNNLTDENQKLKLIDEWATPPQNLLDWVKNINEWNSNVEVSENDWMILFKYGGEGGGGTVYQIPTGRVWLMHSEMGLEEEDIPPVNIEKEFESWELFWEYFINKYPHWEQLHPEFYNTQIL